MPSAARPRPSRRQTLGLGLGLAAALGPAAAAANADATQPAFTLLLVNDVYGMAEVDGRGGLARLNAMVKAERARGVPVLYAHAGDAFSPSLMSGFDKGAHMVDLLGLAPPDVFVPGNHEFDFGPQVFLERIGAARFPTFAANLRDADGGPVPGVRDRALVALGGARVGVVGIALASTPEKSQSGALRFAPELATLDAQARALRAEGAALVVAVVHADRTTDLAMQAAGSADIILSGHDHDLFAHDDGRCLLVESGFDAHAVTALDVILGGGGRGWSARRRVLDSWAATPDPETLALVARLDADLSRELDVPLGQIRDPLDSRIVSVRAREASFGSLVADALRAATGADVALMNGGGIRGNRLYPAGSVLTRRDILQELPFGNTTVLVAIGGAGLRALLENGLSEYGRPAGRFAQVSGLVVRLDPDAPAGARVRAVTVGGAPLDEGRTYTVAANDFLLAGGNGYGALAAGRILVGATDGRLVANEVMAYIRRHAPLPAPEGGRILAGP